jgi:hypothetical protein
MIGYWFYLYGKDLGGLLMWITIVLGLFFLPIWLSLWMRG